MLRTLHLLNLGVTAGNDGSGGGGGGWFGQVKATFKRVMGAATADRRVEAEGAAEERADSTPDEDQIEKAERAVAEKYDETPEPTPRPDPPKGVDPPR